MANGSLRARDGIIRRCGGDRYTTRAIILARGETGRVGTRHWPPLATGHHPGWSRSCHRQWGPFANTRLHVLRIHVQHGFEVTGSGSLDAWHEQAAARTMKAQQPDQPGTGQPRIVPRQHVDQMARAAAIADRHHDPKGRHAAAMAPERTTPARDDRHQARRAGCLRKTPKPDRTDRPSSLRKPPNPMLPASKPPITPMAGV